MPLAAGSLEDADPDSLSALDAMRTRPESLVRRTAWSATASVTATATRLIAGIMLARQLGPSLMGRVVYFVWVADISGTLAGLGLGSSLTRFAAVLGGTSHEREMRGLVSWIARQYMAVAVAGSAVLALIGALRSGEESGEIKRLWFCAGLLLVVQSGGSLYRAYLIGLQRFVAIARLNIASSIVLLIAVAIGIALRSAQVVLLGYALGELLGALGGVGLVARRSDSNHPDRDTQGRVWEFALYSWVAAIVSAVVWSRVEIFFLNRYQSPAEVALFTTAVTISSLVSQTALLVTGALVPHFAQLVGSNDIAGLRKSYASVTRLTGIVLLPLSFGCAALAHLLVPLLYGAAFIRAAVPSAVMAVAAALLVSAPGTAVMYAMEQSKAVAVSCAIGTLAAFFSFMFAIPHFGAAGAAWGRLGTQTVVVILTVVFMSRRTQIYPPLVALLRTAVAALLSALAASIVSHVVDGRGAIAAAIATGIVAYVVALKVLRVINTDDFPRLRQLASRLPHSINSPAVRLLTWISGQ